MSVQHEVGLVALREIRKNLRSTKGIAMFVLFFLGGAVPSVAQVLIQRAQEDAGLANISDEAKKQLLERALLTAYGGSEAIAKYLAECPPVLLFLFQGTLIFTPLLILLVGFDQLAGEIQHRTVRYLAGRANRRSIVIGKALGIWAVVAIMILVLHFTVWMVMLIQSSYPAGLTLSWGFRMWLFAVAYGAAYVGLTCAVSSLFKTPVVALFVGGGVIFGVWLARLIVLLISQRAGAAEAATWVFPATYENLMVSPEPSRALGGTALAVVWGAVWVALAALIIRRRDI